VLGFGLSGEEALSCGLLLLELLTCGFITVESLVSSDAFGFLL
jgi:hypothetical protein